MILAVLAAAATLASAKAEVAQLNWMAGTWTAEAGGATVHLTWLPPLDGAMAAVNQTTVPGKNPSVEFIVLAPGPQGVEFRPFTATEQLGVYRKQPGPDGEAVFENKANAFPERVTYRRCGPDLCTRLEGVANGKPASLDLRFTRLAP